MTARATATHIATSDTSTTSGTVSIGQVKGTTIAEAAAELDVTEEVTAAVVRYVADNYYDAVTGEISEQGMDLVRSQFVNDPGSAWLIWVTDAAEAHARAIEAADKALKVRDSAIRAAANHGHKRTQIAAAADISRERLYQIIGS